MASILVCSSPAYSHVQSCLAVARHLVAGGHRVRFLTGPSYEPAVRDGGIEFLPLPPGAGGDLDDPDTSFPGREGLTGLAAARFDIENVFLKPAPHQLEAIEGAIAAEPVDVVLAEASFVGAALLAARPASTRPVVIALGIFPLALGSVDTAPFGTGIPPGSGPLARLRNRLLNALTARLVFSSAERTLNEMMRGSGREAPVRLFDGAALSDAFLQFTVPGFEYPRRELPAKVRFIGPIPPAPSNTPLPFWWRDLDTGRRVVHVTQGTVANKDLDQLTRPAIAGLAEQQDLLVVVTTGGRDPGDLGPVPGNVRVARYIPHDLLLPRTDVMVTNGGYGGVHQALRHAVPLVVAGATEDKLEVAARVAWSGAGINLRTNQPRAEKLREAVLTVLSDPSYRAAASRLAAEIAAAPGLAAVDEVIAELLAVRR